ncbi:ABC transporter permease [Streptomyces montanisoli]|uniref:Transport permease protein n=1 Tax=Streptomyces montanisoli TaxID=2798581 RepID=A0A940ME23_9ACTN|nr:ABC transporter permease [Streptomyces montanisoli]MBP0456978.1 ABC transporter permease [Streptomyces montanisoli]
MSATATASAGRRPSPAAAVLRTEARLLYLREPSIALSVLLLPTVLLVILGLIPGFREADAGLGGRRVIDLYVPVAVLLALTMAGMQAMPPILTGYRERGILRRMSTTPVRPSAMLVSQLVLLGGGALFSALLAVAVGRIAFGVALPGRPGGYLLALVLAAASAISLGLLISAVARHEKAAQALGAVTLFPSMFTAGVWLPVQTMPHLLRTIVEYTPLGAASQTLDQAARGAFPGLVHLGVTALWTIALTAAAARWFRWQ